MVNSAMVVAVAAVSMMQMAIYEVVDVVAMRDGLVAASRSVLVAGVMGSALMIRCAAHRVRIVNRKAVLVDVVGVRVVKMTVMQIVDVALVLDRQMTAALTVDV